MPVFFFPLTIVRNHGFVSHRSLNGKISLFCRPEMRKAPRLGISMCKNLEAPSRHLPSLSLELAWDGKCARSSARSRGMTLRPSPYQQTAADAKEDQNPKHTGMVLVLADLETISTALLAGSARWESRQRREVGAMGFLPFRPRPAAFIGVPGRLHARGVPLCLVGRAPCEMRGRGPESAAGWESSPGPTAGASLARSLAKERGISDLPKGGTAAFRTQAGSGGCRVRNRCLVVRRWEPGVGEKR